MLPRPSPRFAAVGAAVAVLLCAAPAPGGEGPLRSLADLFGPAETDGPAALFEWPRRDDGCDVTGEGAGGEGDGGTEPLVAERPDFTNSPSTIGRGVAQVEVGYRFVSDGGGADGPAFRSHTVPEALLRVGVLADWFELRLGGDFDIENSAGGGNDAFGDLTPGFKVGLTPQDGWLPESALIARTTFPAGDAAGGALPGLEYVYGVELSERWRIAGSTQVERTDEAGRNDSGDAGVPAAFTRFAQSATVGFTPTERFGTFAEYYALLPERSAGVEDQHFFDAGFTFLLTEDVQFDAFAGAGLNDAADDFFAGTGLVVRRR